MCGKSNLYRVAGFASVGATGRGAPRPVPVEYRRGFTLVELLVVIGIISILIAMLLPALNRARDAANQVACASNMRQYAVATTMYINENKGYFPLYGQNYAVTGPSETLWWNTLAVYMKLPQALDANYYDSLANGLKLTARVRACPADPQYTFIGPNYGGFHAPGTPLYGPFVWGQSSAADPTYGIRVTQVRDANHWILFLETRSPYYEVDSLGNWTPAADTDGDTLPDTYAYYAGWNNYNGGRPKVHRGSSNVAFCDGHVENLPYKTWINPDNGYWKR
jgi:prepilin-type N-terminal cleavage/methylation domain-containing protein/prepilin-type processing-associated H-X9-DG protein